MINKLILWLKEKYNECFFVGSSDKLPPPLDEALERDYIIKASKGDIDAKNKLIEHNLRLVVFLAKKYENTGYDVEDLVSIGSIGLIKGINTYKLDKNIKLATYASRCIENEILMHLRKVVKTRNELSLDEPLNVDGEGNVLLLSDVLGTESDVIYKDLESDVEKDILIASFNKLPPRERQIVKLRFGILGSPQKTQKEIADMFGISQSYISRLEKKVINKLKKEMSKMV